MNWYKKALYEEFDWDRVFRELQSELKRRPTKYEVQREINRRRFDDSYKKELVST